ncbi:hypothetical protein ABEF92_008278 [Exophiala dermatitidis]|uniref:Hydantoin racemase n=1 Tax=Exophiala dermatitidis (strain ATCC 34100 / CBS 525.76 / NIH/UT8656) TaxID=858893 RepID=H6BS72_EXODN|nr:uncharacterized protein HMPREF1120_02303 [Exophiala dermatitidis NIH/UT8656]EHY54127.1 hypothetical protein HMPREF1120_02303 [Exophiala dermatitidis NIH/UT8656]
MVDFAQTPSPALHPSPPAIEQTQSHLESQFQPRSQSEFQLDHPLSLRPGGASSRSSSPIPSPPQPDHPLLSGEPSRESSMSSYQSPPLQRQRSPPDATMNMNMNMANNYSGRFPSQNYPPQSPTNEPGSSSGNPYVEGSSSQVQPQSQSQSQSGSRSRSRSSTIGQSYPVALQPPMPNSPPQTQTQPIQPQPLFAQHSGSPSNQAAKSSRPVSRSAQSNNPMAMMQGGLGCPVVSNGAAAAGPSSRPGPSTNTRSPFSTPVTALSRQRPYQLLLINPCSTRSLTESCLTSIRPIIPTGIEVTGYTAPYPAPTAIESTTDAIMSTEAVLRDLAKHAASNGETVQNYDGMIVACFSKHPLIDALRESYDVPVIGIMEASLYVARMLGGRFGIVATAQRSKIMNDDQVASYGLSHFYVGSESTHLGVLELLESRPREEVAERIAHASRSLVGKGADTILLGSAGMADMMRAAKDAVRDEDGRRTVNIIDPVEAGIMMMASLVGMGIPTSKKGLYKGEKEARRTRGQNWL